MLGVFVHIIFSVDTLKILMKILNLIIFVMLSMSYKWVRSDKFKLKIWYFGCFLPLILSFIHLYINVIGSVTVLLFPVYISIYIPALIISFYPLLVKNKTVRLISNVLIMIACLYYVFLPFDYSKKVNYTRKSLKDSYISLCNYFEKHYILNDWKKINYKKLKKKGIVLIDEAIEMNNIDKYYEALDNFVNYFNDGHMSLGFYNENDYIQNKMINFNDYGLSMVKLDDGKIMVVNTVDDLEIKSGDIVTKWNDKSIDESLKKIKLPYFEPVKSNEDILKPIYLAASGGDTVKVTYINSAAEEKEITLSKKINTYPRIFETIDILNHANNDDSSRMLSKDIGYISIKSEQLDYNEDLKAYFTGNHKLAREKYRKELRNLKEKGMNKLVIDLRNNRGGYDEISLAFVSLFAREKMFGYSLGVKLTNKNIGVSDRYIYGDGEFSDIKVLVLTNMGCASAGDGMVSYLSKLDNVTIAGISNSKGIDQEIGGYIYMPKGAVISFPIGLVLDKENNPNIDVDFTRKSRNHVDIKIPFDKEAALKIFNYEDYELAWAIDYLEKF